MNGILVLAVALGGAIGATARYTISHLVSLRGESLFPWGTLIANLLGCFMLGLVYEMSELVALNPNAKAMISVGLIGALTTFSTFTLETINLLRKQQWCPAFLNMMVSILAGFAACVFGIFVIRLAARAISG
jgi:fluoride exporter